MTEYLLGSYNSYKRSAINCWNCTTGNIEHSYRSQHISVRNSLCVLLNDYILTADKDKPLLHVWPINSQEAKTRLILPGSAEAVCVDNSCTYLLVGIGVRVYIWMIRSGELLNMLEKNYQPISCIKVSNTTEHLVVASKDGFLLAYNFNNAISRSLTGQSEPLFIKCDHTDPITDVAIGNFGNKSRVASVSSDKTCRVYNLYNGDPLKVLIFSYSLSSVIMDVMCWNLYVGGSYGTISLVQLENGSLTQHINNGVPCFKGHLNRIVCMDININQNVLATASDDCSIIIWDLKTRRQLRMIKLDLPATCLRFLSAHRNINSKAMKPQIVLKPLKKSITVNIENLETSIMHTDHIEFEDSIKIETNDVKTVNNDDVDQLKVINKQLFDALVAMNWKNHANSS